MNTDVMFSRKTDNWATPPEFFLELDKEFHFDLDPAADDINHKCDRYFTVAEDGLLQEWGDHSVFCNPPYGREIGKWVEKAYRTNKESGNLVVMLLPARTDTRWFHDFIYKKAEIRFVTTKNSFRKRRSFPVKKGCRSYHNCILSNTISIPVRLARKKPANCVPRS